MRFVSLVLLFACGCATIKTWNEMGQSHVQIIDAKVVSTPDGLNCFMKIIGEKDVPSIPFLFNITLDGEVDTIPIVETEGESKLCRVELNGAYQTNHIGNLRVLQSNSGVNCKGSRESPTFEIADNISPMLIDDLHRYRCFIAVQMTEGNLDGGAATGGIFALQCPYVNYRTHDYVCREEGLRVIAGRILVTPFAFVADVAFLPVGLLLAPFVHM